MRCYTLSIGVKGGVRCGTRERLAQMRRGTLYTLKRTVTFSCSWQMAQRVCTQYSVRGIVRSVDVCYFLWSAVRTASDIFPPINTDASVGKR